MFRATMICLLLAGCSSQVIEPQPFKNADTIKPLATIDLEAIELKSKPIALIHEKDNVVYASFTEEQMVELNRIWKAARANEKTIAILNKANKEAVGSHNNLLNLTKIYERQIYVVEKELARSERIREKEEKISTLRSIIDKTIIVVLGIALIL